MNRRHLSLSRRSPVGRAQTRPGCPPLSRPRPPELAASETGPTLIAPFAGLPQTIYTFDAPEKFPLDAGRPSRADAAQAEAKARSPEQGRILEPPQCLTNRLAAYYTSGSLFPTRAQFDESRPPAPKPTFPFRRASHLSSGCRVPRRIDRRRVMPEMESTACNLSHPLSGRVHSTRQRGRQLDFSLLSVLQSGGSEGYASSEARP